ncbi:MAG: sugar phosphate isomerase/epimerase family protein [Armatimonadota bacterium]|nr:sugar phosphate isomerase/epimerase family protein [Armatimonadota bacterium]
MRIGFMMGYDRERMEFAKRYGFRSLELMAEPGNGFFPGDAGWEAKADEVKAAFAAEDLRISCVAGFYINHMDPAQEAAARERTRGTILLAERLGVGVVAGFAGRIVEEELDASLPKFKEMWGEHARFAEDHGVKIAFENCPMGQYGLPVGGINMMCTPDMWEKAFDAVPSPALGLEWDPSHLICMFIDPVANLKKFGAKAYHVHAKDAHVDRELMSRRGVWYPGVVEHCSPAMGDTDWALCIKELLRQGYASDLNIEGWHDAVYNREKEDEGLVIALRQMEQFVLQD